MMNNEEANQLPEDQSVNQPTSAESTEETPQQEAMPVAEAPTEVAAGETVNAADQVEEEADDSEDQGGAIAKIEAEDDHDTPREKKLPIPEYDDLSIDESLAVIKEHVAQYSPERIKGIVESGSSRILSELNHEKELARRAHLEEFGNDLEFRFDQPQRKVLSAIYTTYRDGLRAYYATLEKQLSHNLEVKSAIVEQIKALPMDEGSAKSKYDRKGETN